MLNARPVRGFFRRLRWAADGILIAILLVTPWITIGGGEPLVRFDLPARKFHVFGLLIFPQELYFLWLIVIGLVLALFFFTALAGRLWCGWACPQTVLTDVYAGLARFVEGWSGSARPRRVSVVRMALKYLLFAGVSTVLGFHLVSYFVGPRELAAALWNGEASATQTGFFAVATVLSYVDFVVLRQTFCKYLCPYARLQGVLFDGDTLVVAYDPARGEPRARGAARRERRDGGASAGDCVDCGLCVAVCPSGIDIRRGLQLECVACTQCIDACNEVMEQVGKPPRLIGYRSLVGLERRRRVRLVRPRVVAYGAGLAIAGVAFVAALAMRHPIGFQVVHNVGALFGETADGRTSNAFVLRIENRDLRPHAYRVRLEAPHGFELVAGMNPVQVPAATAQESRVFVLHQGSEATGAGAELRFVLEQVDEPSNVIERTVRFLVLGLSANSGGIGGAR